MIKANHHIAYEKYFDLYLGWIMRRDFRAHRIVELPVSSGVAAPGKGSLLEVSPGFYDPISDHALLMVGNHFSWWDGFFARRINQQVLHKRLHVMMLEEQLRPRMFLTRLGAYSIRQKHRSALESVNYTLELLENPENLVVMFPQGRFQSLHQHPVHFEQGWFRILEKSPRSARLVFMANLTDYFDHRKPTLSSYLRLMDKDSFADARAVEQAYNDFLLDAISAQKVNSP